MLNVLLTRYSPVLLSLLTDLVAISVMSYFLYFRRHWRSDLLLSYVALNFGIFTVMTVLTQVKLDIATGFGLFAILSIIRLRSSAVTQQEVAYYFVALVLGLINGLGVADRTLSVVINIVLLVIMAIFDSRALRERAKRMDVHLDHIYSDERELVAELENQLGARVVYHEVTELNFKNHNTVVDVRIRPDRRLAQQAQQRHNEHAQRRRDEHDARVASRADGVAAGAGQPSPYPHNTPPRSG